ncbi:SGNH/GDSL hydrolase family protein [Fibrella aquatilis]|uniref:SGNH/GDSL hydrolase family protein n=1 Tax=Fibrella aquatilis TaxID=2817059 RepID=A0A939K130_9BACT|nr:SGNH/GDSL hydrolase family protein [Fibrella aquatilis]MBO0932621.1 SGNH/GDSL hydrolase family protein [Fibrella aquatilis]
MKKLLLLTAIIFLFSAARPTQQTWVAIGDSITYLNDHLNETGNRVTKGYMTRVTEKLPHLTFVNQGHNGWTSGQIAESVDKLGLVKANVYSVFLGTNDWWRGRPLGRLSDYQANTGNATVYGSFRIIINKLRSLNPQAKIVLITPMQRADFVYLTNFKNNAYGSYKAKNGQYLEAFANAIDSIGRVEQVPVVDLYHVRQLGVAKLVKFKRLKNPQTGVYTNYPYPAFIDVPFSPDTDEYPYPTEAIEMTYDGLHPSDAGYAQISKRLVKVLKKL